ncbi:hypothetical protein [Curtobacterium sp. C2H10]|uniref:hypothetical protein n=1 Tax=Curtobacterium sp. C2H10 TaxID=2736664 RepID=UPI0021C2236F|nr:hypothetical protein [Curtobacterium sp. C2H10]MCT9620284.1 hypothetical protein [Curtobacterium sp. C2H10]
MQDVTDGWVRRLRDGTAPRQWPIHLAAAVLVLGAPALIVAEFGSPAFVEQMDRSSRVGSVVLVELFLTVVGIVMSVGTWWSGRRDRRTLARIRAGGREPAFFLPVLTKGIRTSEDLPRPRPEVWTLDRAGMHGWAPDREAPVIDLPWSRIRTIDLATKDARGSRVDYALWFDLVGGGELVLPPRTALGRPFEVGPGGLETLLPVLRSLRRELVD